MLRSLHAVLGGPALLLRGNDFGALPETRHDVPGPGCRRAARANVSEFRVSVTGCAFVAQLFSSCLGHLDAWMRAVLTVALLFLSCLLPRR